MVEVFVGVGSNVDREDNLRAGVAALREAFDEVRVSTVWDNPAVGFRGDDFLNLVAAFDTDLPATAVADRLDVIEDRFGRRRDGGDIVSRTLDLDLLLYGDAVIDDGRVRVPRPDVSEYAFVLCPLAELAPERRHPVLGTTFREMWAAFEGDGNRLSRWPLEL